jgi:F0F1-type ATP synthase assembly protein I
VTDDDFEHAASPEEFHGVPSSDGPAIRDLLSLGGMLVGCIVVGVAIGLFADARLGSSPSGVLIGTGLGIVAASVGFVLRVRGYLTGR